MRKGIGFLAPPAFSCTSNGHRTLIQVIQQCRYRGLDCLIVSEDPDRLVSQSTINIKDQILIENISELAERVQVCVVSDTSREEHVAKIRSKGIQIIWWMMAPVGFFDGGEPNVHKDDICIPYSSFVYPGSNRYWFYHESTTIDAIRDIDSDGQVSRTKRLGRTRTKKTIGIYSGKGRISLLEPPLERELSSMNLVEITRSRPRQKSDYVRLMDSIDGLISFDPLTAVALDVAMQGKPVYIVKNPFPVESFSMFPIKEIESVKTSAEEFIQALVNKGCRVARSNEVERLNQSMLGCIAQDLEAIFENRLRLEAFPDAHKILDFGRQIRKAHSLCLGIDGQAPSSRLLSLYIWLMRKRLTNRKVIRLLIGHAFSKLDILTETRLGRFILRSTIYIKSSVGSVLWRITRF